MNLRAQGRFRLGHRGMPPTRSSIIELGHTDPNDPALLERMRQAERKWRKEEPLSSSWQPQSAPPTSSLPILYPSTESVENVPARESYVPLPSPVAEAERRWYNQALAASTQRALQTKLERERSEAQREVFTASLTRRVDELLGSRRAR